MHYYILCYINFGVSWNMLRGPDVRNIRYLHVLDLV